MSNKWKTVWALLNPKLKADYAEHYYKAVAVVAAPFNCYRDGEQSDLSNRQIAQIAADRIRDNPLRFFGQWEQCSLLKRHSVRMPIYQYPCSFGKGEHVTTYELVRWIALKADSLGLRLPKVIVVGHPHHVRRVGILLKYFGLEPMMSLSSDLVPYDPQHKSLARHPWTLSAWRYIPWEYASRVHHALMIATGKW